MGCSPNNRTEVDGGRGCIFGVFGIVDWNILNEAVNTRMFNKTKLRISWFDSQLVEVAA